MFESITSLARAGTNFITIDEATDEAAAEKLLAWLGRQNGPWYLCRTEIDRKALRNPAMAIHACKQRLRAHTGMAPGTIAFVAGQQRHQFYYLSPQPNEETFAPNKEDAPTVLRLVLLAALLNAGTSAPATQSLGPFVYVGARTRTHKDSCFVEAFMLETDWRHRELQINLKAKSMRVPLGAMKSQVLSAEEGKTPVMITQANPEQVHFLDGRKTRLDDIVWLEKRLPGSRWYLLNRLTEFFMQTLAAAGVAHRRREFAPAHATVVPRLHIEALARTGRELCLVNNTRAALSPALREHIEATLAQAPVVFDAIVWHEQGAPSRDRSWLDRAARQALLVLNQRRDETGSIEADRTSLDRPWEAYHGLAQSNLAPEDVDDYTWAKYATLFERRVPGVVLQGIDMDAPNVDDALEPETLSTGQIQAFKRCAIELAIKAHAARARVPLAQRLDEHGLPLGRFTLLYTERVRLKLFDNELMMMATVVEIEVHPTHIDILGSEFLRDLSSSAQAGLFERFPCLGNKFVNDAFYLIDASGERFLRRFSGAFVPKILLNAQYASIDEALTALRSDPGGLSPRGSFSRSDEWLVLPYYTNAGKPNPVQWRDRVFIEDRGSFLRYFVPAKLAMKESAGFSNLHDLMLFQQTGVGFAPIDGGLLDEPLMRLYLGTLTTGIMRLNESGKTSLLEKIVRLAGMDT